jgi:hypothetical protein
MAVNRYRVGRFHRCHLSGHLSDMIFDSGYPYCLVTETPEIA